MAAFRMFRIIENRRAAPQFKTESAAINSRENPSPPKIFVVDDEYFVRQAICALATDIGWESESFATCESFLENYDQRDDTCLVLDVNLPGMGGLELLGRIAAMANGLPVVVVSGCSGISVAVQSMKAGAVDFIEKPVGKDALRASVLAALSRSRRSRELAAIRTAAHNHITDLSNRQREIMELVLAGSPSKIIAADLGISQRTVETHRASIMQRTGASSLPELTRLVMCDRCALAS